MRECILCPTRERANAFCARRANARMHIVPNARMHFVPDAQTRECTLCPTRECILCPTRDARMHIVHDARMHMVLYRVRTADNFHNDALALHHSDFRLFHNCQQQQSLEHFLFLEANADDCVNDAASLAYTAG